jgi:hypothetical protein
MVRRIGVATAVLAMLASLLGCATSQSSTVRAGASPASAPPSVEALVGQYALVAVDGHALPYAPRVRGGSAGAPAWPVVSGSLALNLNGTFRLETSYDASTDGGRKSFQFGGTCYTSNDEVRMVWDGGGLTNLKARGDTLLLDNDGTAYSYVRR